MTFFEMVVLGAAMACDAFAVTLSNTLVFCAEKRSRLMVMPVLFGLFQGLMPVAGYFLGTIAADIVEAYAGIVALVLLGVIGTNMIREGVAAVREHAINPPVNACELPGGAEAAPRLTWSTLLMEAFATAIDAFAVGVSLVAMGANIALASITIGVVTALICAVGVLIGRRVGPTLGDKAQIFGGVVLWVIGLRAFFF